MMIRFFFTVNRENGCATSNVDICTEDGDTTVGPDQKCVSFTPSITNDWCKNNGCGETHPTICTLRGDTDKKDDKLECVALVSSVTNEWCR